MDKITKNHKNIKELVDYSKEGILSKQLTKTDKVDITLFCMAKGTEISEHTTTKEGFIYVVEGDGIFNLEGEDITMLPDVFIFMKRNAIHSLKVNKNTSFILSLFS
jgi:nitric oxide dioxygenase